MKTPDQAKRFRTKHRLCISRLFACMVGIYLLGGHSYWSEQAPVFSAFLFLAGCAIGGAGAYGRVWALSHIAGRKREELVTTGPYSLCRNPIYFSSLMLGVGFMLCAGSLVLAGITALSFCALYAFVLSKEERELEAVHGPEFVSYCKVTPAFWPRLSGLREGESTTILVSPFRRGICAVALYLPLVGCVHLWRTLHDVGNMPCFYTFF